MAHSVIFTVDPSGKLMAMQSSKPRSEDFMQELIAAHPELVADQDGELLLITREQPIADQGGGSGRWSLDHLFVTRAGVPVLIEVKRAVDTRLRREVVGQMLDYAANATAYWQAGRVAESFAKTMLSQQRDPDEILAGFLGGLVSPDNFWQQIDANFAAGRIKLVFVADVVPRELARVVEFLNEQMKADVRAIELSWFEGEAGVTALVPRTIGETERAQSTKAARQALPQMDRSEWIEQRLRPYGSELVSAAGHFIDMVEGLGGNVVVTSTRGSLTAVFETIHGLMYPFRVAPEKGGLAQLNLIYLAYSPAFAGDDARQALYDQLTSIVGQLSTHNLRGYPGFDARLMNDESVLSDLCTFLRRLVEKGNEAAGSPATLDAG